jgi:hypothetical protein
MDLVTNAQALAAQFNAADMLWIAGAVLLGFLAIKVVLKILKIVFIIGAVLLVVAFFFSSGIIPGI